MRILLVVAIYASMAWSNEAYAARAISATISVGGKTVLNGATYDDGRVDADGVWEYLKSIKFKPTEEFKEFKVDATAEEIVLSTKGPSGEISEIVVTIRSGGKATANSRARSATLGDSIMNSGTH